MPLFSVGTKLLLSETIFSFIFTVPPVCFSRPAIILNKVVLPHPDGPNIDTISPLDTFKLMFFRTSMSVLNECLRFFISRVFSVI